MGRGGEVIRRSRPNMAAEHPSSYYLGSAHRRLSRMTCVESLGRGSGEAAVVGRREEFGTVPSNQERSDTILRTRGVPLKRGGSGSVGCGNPRTRFPKHPEWRRRSRWRIGRSAGPERLRTKKKCRREKGAGGTARDTRDEGWP